MKVSALRRLAATNFTNAFICRVEIVRTITPDGPQDQLVLHPVLDDDIVIPDLDHVYIPVLTPENLNEYKLDQ